MGIMQMGFYFLLEIKASFCQAYKFLNLKKKKKSDFEVSQENVQVGSLYTDFKGFFLIKTAKRMCICEYFIFTIDACEKCFLGFKKGISRFLRQVAAKHTAP